MHTQGVETTGYSDLTRGRLPSLTGMRWYAAATIFLYHALSVPILFMPGVVASPVKTFFNVTANMSLSFFFVLSGFVLTASVRRNDSAVRFWRRRAMRVYPVNVIVTLLTVAFLTWTAYTATVHHVAEALVLVQPWFLSLSYVGVNPVTWSLACEVFFYLCFPLLLLLINKINRDKLIYWVVGVVVGTFLVPLLAKVLFADTPVLPFSPVSEKQALFTAWFPPSRMLEFVLGILLARMMLTRKFDNVPRWFAWSALAVAVGIGMVFDPALHTMVAVTIIPVALVIRATASADIRGRSSIFGSRAMVRLGNLSFAFYVLHVIVLMNVARLFTGVTDWSFVSVVGVLLLSFVITIALSAVLHFGVEQPLYRRFANPRRDKEPTPSADLGQSAGDRA